MNYKVAMCVLHRLTDFDEELQSLLDAQLLVVAVLIDDLAMNILHDQIRLSLTSLTGVQQSCDVGMIEVGKNLAFALKAALHIVIKECIRHDLDCHTGRVLAI